MDYDKRPAKVLDQLTLFFENDIKISVYSFCKAHKRFTKMYKHNPEAKRKMIELAEEIFKKAIIDKYDPDYKIKKLGRLAEKMLDYEAIMEQPNFNMKALEKVRDDMNRVHKMDDIQYFWNFIFSIKDKNRKNSTNGAIALGLANKYHIQGHYAYVCPKCKKTFREKRTVKIEYVECPHCGNDKNIERMSGENLRILTPDGNDALTGISNTKRFGDLGVYENNEYDPTLSAGKATGIGNMIGDYTRNIKRDPYADEKRQKKAREMVNVMLRELSAIEGLVLQRLAEEKSIEFICQDVKRSRSSVYDIINRINTKCLAKGYGHFKNIVKELPAPKRTVVNNINNNNNTPKIIRRTNRVVKKDNKTSKGLANTLRESKDYVGE
jgi:Zn ribbon nucleic-acid-binding protein